MHRLRLEEAAEVVARHADFSRRGAVVLRCVEEVEQRFQVGRISIEQRERLLAILRRPTESTPQG